MRHPDRGHPLGVRMEGVKERRHDQAEDGNQQYRRAQPRHMPIEGLHLVLETAREQRDPQHKEEIAEDRPSDRRLDQVYQSGPQRNGRDDQLGEIAHGGAEHATYGGARVVRHRLGCRAEHARQGNDRRGAQQKDKNRRSPEEPRRMAIGTKTRSA